MEPRVRGRPRFPYHQQWHKPHGGDNANGELEQRAECKGPRVGAGDPSEGNGIVLDYPRRGSFGLWDSARGLSHRRLTEDGWQGAPGVRKGL